MIDETLRRKPEFVNSLFEEMTSALGLPQEVKQTAVDVYRNAVKKHLVLGKSIESVAAAVLYSACRQCNVPRTLDEISSASGISRKKIGRVYKHISQELGFNLAPASPIEYVPRFCSELRLYDGVQVKAVDILKWASEKGIINGHNPTSMAAAAVYIASILCNDRKTQQEVARAAGITEVTVRNNFKELNQKLGIGLII